MGCPCEIRLFDKEYRRLHTISRQLEHEARRFEHRYSRYRADSIISKINNSAGQAAVAIDQETSAIMQYSAVCYVQSNGAFDITSGVLGKLWNRNMQELPSDSDIKNCLDQVGWEKVELEEDSIRLTVTGMELDLGGVVKEYAADAMANMAREHEIEHGYINLGGDVSLVGPQPNGSPWPIGISNPNNPARPIATLMLDSGAVSTSGGYERYTEVAGKKYSHLINPKTGWPVDSLVSVSVAAPQAVVAGSLTSIALLHGAEGGIEFLERCGVPYFAIDQQGQYHGPLKMQEQAIA